MHKTAWVWVQNEPKQHLPKTALQWTPPTRRKPRRPKTTAQHLAPEWQTWKQNYCCPLYVLFGMKRCTLECFLQILQEGKVQQLLLLLLLFYKIFFRISCTSSMKIFGVMLKKEMPITIPFLYSMQTSVQTLYTSMNTSYQFSDLITTIVSNN